MFLTLEIKENSPFSLVAMFFTALNLFQQFCRGSPEWLFLQNCFPFIDFRGGVCLKFLTQIHKRNWLHPLAVMLFDRSNLFCVFLPSDHSTKLF